jgi:DNA-binding transcriptional LysR family regulator
VVQLSWEDAQTFLTVAEEHSFSAAARVLGLGQPTVSRRIQALETRLRQIWRRSDRSRAAADSRSGADGTLGG